MKKSLVLVATILVAFVVIGPKFAGDTFNESLDDYITAINEAGVYQASVESREKSWFFTEADIQVALNLPGISNDPQFSKWYINLQAKAQHGPILTTNGFALGWLDWSVDMISEDLPATLVIEDESSIYQATGKMGFFGGTSYRDRIASMSYTDPTNGMTLSMDAWQGKGYLSADSTAYEGSLSNLQMTMPDIYELQLSELSSSIDAKTSLGNIIKGGFYSGSSSLSLQQLDITNLLENSSSKLKHLLLKLSSEFNKESDLANIQMDTSLASITASDFDIVDLVFSSEINNLQQSFFNAYQQMNKDIMQSPERAQELMQETMKTHLLGQLQAEPELNITAFTAVLNDANVNASSSNKLIGVDSLPDTMQSNDFWIQHIDSDTQISADEGAAKFIASIVIKSQLAGNPQAAEMDPAELEMLISQQSENFLNGFVQQGLLTKTENTYAMSFVLKEGKGSLNGEQIPLPE